MSILEKALIIASEVIRNNKIRLLIKLETFAFLCGCVVCIVACRYIDDRMEMPDMVVEARAPIHYVDNVLADELKLVNSSAPSYDDEAKWVARVMYGMVGNTSHSDDAKRAIVWCIINRVESAQFGSSIKDVCDQPTQWMGYSSENPVLQDLYNIALEVLTIWHDKGIRPVSNDFVFLDWSRDSITLLTTYGVNSTTRKWQVS